MLSIPSSVYFLSFQVSNQLFAMHLDVPGTVLLCVEHFVATIKEIIPTSVPVPWNKELTTWSSSETSKGSWKFRILSIRILLLLVLLLGT